MFQLVRLLRFVSYLYIFLYSSYFIFAQNPVPNNIGAPINTPSYREYAPSVSATGKTIIFESNREGANNWKLYESNLQANGRWSEPKYLTNINTFGSSSDLIGGPSISYDGNMLFFFASYEGGLGSEDIYYSIREGNEWSKPINIGYPINTSGYEGFPSISSDGKSLYFVRDAEVPVQNFTDNKITETVNCFKIFVSEKGPDGKWKKPYALPDFINKGCEKSPKIMSDNQTLIFASRRPGGVGKFDLYLTKKDKEGNWSEPVNLKFVNTPEDDQFASVSASGDLMYFYTKDDIYTIEIPVEYHQNKNITITGVISDANTGKPIPNAVIEVSDAITSEVVFVTTNNVVDGKYVVVLTEGRMYDMKVTAENYSTNTAFYDLVKIDKYQEIERNIQLSSYVKLHLNIYENKYLTPLNVEVIVESLQNKEITKEFSVKSVEGKATLNLPIGKKYNISTFDELYKPYNFDFDLTSLVKFPDFERDIILELVKDTTKLTEIKGVVKDAAGAPIKAVIEIIDIEKNIVVARVEAGPNGEYKVNLPPGKNYGIKVSSENYLFHSENFDIDADGSVKELKLDVALKKAEAGAKIVLNNIFFDFGKTSLRQESMAEIESILKLLNEMPNIKVEISGHTDNIGSAASNQRISEERAKSVVDYLVSKGADKSRLQYKGYGFSQPTAPNDTEEGRQKNRRTEFKIISN